MYVNYEYYRIFYTAARCGSFTEAAALLKSNQPNVTRVIRQLEGQLGCTLFIRSHRGVSLTPEGELLYRHVEAAVFQLSAAEREMDETDALRQGIVTIGATETALNIFLLDRLSAFREDYPNIRLHIANHLTVEAARAAAEGTCDFSVVTTPMPTDLPLTSKKLCDFREILIASPKLFLDGEKKISLPEISCYPLIAMGRNTMTYRFFQEQFFLQNLPYEPDTEVATADQILPLVRAGLGIAFVPEPMAKEALASGTAVRLHLQQKLPKRSVCLLYRKDRSMSRAAEALFLQYL